jgi:hypothetical protein
MDNVKKYFFKIKKEYKKSKSELKILFASMFLFGMFITGSLTGYGDNFKMVSKVLSLQNRENKQFIQDRIKNHFISFSKSEKHLIFS